jgi:hypothetical protein
MRNLLTVCTLKCNGSSPNANPPLRNFPAVACNGSKALSSVSPGINLLSLKDFLCNHIASLCVSSLSVFQHALSSLSFSMFIWITLQYILHCMVHFTHYNHILPQALYRLPLHTLSLPGRHLIIFTNHKHNDPTTSNPNNLPLRTNPPIHPTSHPCRMQSPRRMARRRNTTEIARSMGRMR